MADSGKPIEKECDRRTFLKIGAGVVAGAAVVGVASVASVAYYNNVLGNNSSSSSSAVGSLQNQLSSTQEQLTSTQDQLNSTASQLSSAQGQVSSLNNQLNSTQAQLTSANSQLSGVNTQLTSANSQLTATQQALTSANGQVTSLQSAVSSASSQVTTLENEVTSLQSTIAQTMVFQTLSLTEQPLVAAIAETLIPTDSNGAGAKEAGVVYFIDHQLNSVYGTGGAMYMQGPFIEANLTTPVTVNGATYSGGTLVAGLDAGMRYQYPMTPRQYWRDGLLAIEAYANSAYGGNFETLSAANQVACLTDIYNNKLTTASFNNIIPQEFFYEVFFMTWSGFLMDPMYGGNQGLVGWTLTGFNGTNTGNFYNEGYSPKQIMLMTTPLILKPASLGQLQQASS
jgi:gluconate 2-dehydrogenase gamma chain